MKVHHISCGTLCPMGALIMSGHGGLLEPARLVCHCLLIESNDGLILVDTGIGLEDQRDPVGRIGRLPATVFRIEEDASRTAIRQVERLGFDPRDVRHLVMTHLDFDHAGGLPDFPWASVHILDIELQAAMNPTTTVERNRYAAAQFAHQPDWNIHSINRGERWFGFENVRPMFDIEPDLLLIPLFGHTRGHCGVAINDGSGWLLHCGDAVFHHNELDPVQPDAPVGIRMLEHWMKDDIEAVEANQALLRQLLHEQEGLVKIICSHDVEMFEASVAEQPVRAYAS